ncbi:hypothetical protein [Thermovenabulum sp.]
MKYIAGFLFCTKEKCLLLFPIIWMNNKKKQAMEMFNVEEFVKLPEEL